MKIAIDTKQPCGICGSLDKADIPVYFKCAECFCNTDWEPEEGNSAETIAEDVKMRAGMAALLLSLEFGGDDGDRDKISAIITQAFLPDNEKETTDGD